jgi:O-antigen/teichoic acid export membrane protein
MSAETTSSTTSKKMLSNSVWGVISNIVQNVLLSVFFVMMVRSYSKIDFANYIIANTVYSFILGFSSLGLGYWFIREVLTSSDKKQLVQQFFKMQLIIGVVFYLLNTLICCLLYSDPIIQKLSAIIGINIIFDNVIYVVKYLNIAEQQQKKSSILLMVEALLKCGIGVILFFTPINLLLLVVILIGLRFFTLNLFIKYGSTDILSLKDIIRTPISFQHFKTIIGANWSFVIIGSLSIINWRIGNIIVSKFLSLADVSNYEVSFKLLSLAYILPVIVSSAILPVLINKHKSSFVDLQQFYKAAFILFAVFGLLSFTFVQSFSDFFVPLLFGENYADTAQYCTEMFLVMLVFPTVLIQANVLITIKLEKIDMVCNLVGLLVNVLLCLIGLYFYKNLSVVNYAIFISFIVFHIIQDAVLIRNKITNIQHVVLFYLISIVLIAGFFIPIPYCNVLVHFVVYWIVVGLLLWIFSRNYIRHFFK